MRQRNDRRTSTFCGPDKYSLQSIVALAVTTFWGGNTDADENYTGLRFNLARIARFRYKNYLVSRKNLLKTARPPS
jgi:hypothetical protein